MIPSVIGAEIELWKEIRKTEIGTTSKGWKSYGWD